MLNLIREIIKWKGDKSIKSITRRSHILSSFYSSENVTEFFESNAFVVENPSVNKSSPK